MTTQLAPDRIALPPPMALDLIDGERVVGWIADRAFGFSGFANEAEAAGAAWVAYRTVARQLARRHGTRPIPIDIEPLALARDGNREVILASNREIGTLVRPSMNSRSGQASFGFEIRMPAPTDELTVRSFAHLAYRTLRRSGVRWKMWIPDQLALPSLSRPRRELVDDSLPSGLGDGLADQGSPANGSGDGSPLRRRPRRLPSLAWRRAS